MIPGYRAIPSVPDSSRLVFTIPYEPPVPGNCADAVEQYSAKSGRARPARANTARSNAEETWPGLS